MKIETREQLEQYLHGVFKIRFDSYLNKKHPYELKIVDGKSGEERHNASVEINNGLTGRDEAYVRMTIYFIFDEGEWVLTDRAHFVAENFVSPEGHMCTITNMTEDYAYTVYDEYRIQCFVVAKAGIDILKFRNTMDNTLRPTQKPDPTKPPVEDYRTKLLSKLFWLKRMVTERPKPPSLKESIARIIRSDDE